MEEGTWPPIPSIEQWQRCVGDVVRFDDSLGASGKGGESVFGKGRDGSIGIQREGLHQQTRNDSTAIGFIEDRALVGVNVLVFVVVDDFLGRFSGALFDISLLKEGNFEVLLVAALADVHRWCWCLQLIAVG